MRKLSLLLVLSLILVGCGTTTPETETETETETEIETVEETTVETVDETNVETEGETTEESTGGSTGQEPTNPQAKQLLDILEEAYAGLAKFAYAEEDGVHYYYFYPEGDFAQEIVDFINDRTNAALDNRWDGTVKNFAELGGNARELVQEDVAFIVLNPANFDNYILGTLNDEITYDMREDF